MLVERGNSGKRGVTNVVWKCFAQVNFNIGVERTCGILAQCGHHEEASAVRSILAEVPQVDHRIGQRFEGVAQPAEAIEPKQQAAKFILPAKDPLDGIEPLFKNGRVEEWFAATFGASSTAGVRVDIGNRPQLMKRSRGTHETVSKLGVLCGTTLLAARRLGEINVVLVRMFRS